jgi:hypothetical protein
MAIFFLSKNDSSRPKIYLVSLFVCSYASTLVSIVIDLAVNAGFLSFLAIVSAGLLIDFIRHKLVPELKWTSAERDGFLKRCPV